MPKVIITIISVSLKGNKTFSSFKLVRIFLLLAASAFSNLWTVYCFKPRSKKKKKKSLWNRFIFRVISPEDLLVDVSDLSAAVYLQHRNTEKQSGPT